MNLGCHGGPSSKKYIYIYYIHIYIYIYIWGTYCFYADLMCRWIRSHMKLPGSSLFRCPVHRLYTTILKANVAWENHCLENHGFALGAQTNVECLILDFYCKGSFGSSEQPGFGRYVVAQNVGSCTVMPGLHSNIQQLACYSNQGQESGSSACYKCWNDAPYSTCQMIVEIAFNLRKSAQHWPSLREDPPCQH